jgi:hypothetical protein
LTDSTSTTCGPTDRWHQWQVTRIHRPQIK